MPATIRIVKFIYEKSLCKELLELSIVTRLLARMARRTKRGYCSHKGFTG